jgi:hypothetical protein
MYTSRIEQVGIFIQEVLFSNLGRGRGIYLQKFFVVLLISFRQLVTVTSLHILGWLVDSCCSHLEHRASVKRSVSLQFLNLRYSVGLFGREISPSQGRYLHTEQHKHRINTDIHALSGIRTHDPSVRASEDGSCLRPRGYCDRLTISLPLHYS